jgi:LmbE family N-acetylglucosaminyl deacetylase
MLSFGPDGLSGHTDHIAIGQAALEAYARTPEVAAFYTLAVPLSAAQALEMRQVQAVPDAQIDLRVDVSSVWETKLAAIHCHATQLSSTPLLRAPEDRPRLFFGREYFVKAAERRSEENFLPGVLKDYLL